VAKSLLILMSKGDMVNGERLTPEVERERGKVTTLIAAEIVRFSSVWIDAYRRKRSDRAGHCRTGSEIKKEARPSLSTLGLLVLIR